MSLHKEKQTQHGTRGKWKAQNREEKKADRWGKEERVMEKGMERAAVVSKDGMLFFPCPGARSALFFLAPGANVSCYSSGEL